VQLAPTPAGSPYGRLTWLAAKLSNSACSSAGSSNHHVGPAATMKGSRARKAMVRPERFELPASWFVARRSIQLSYGRARGANITTSISERHSDAICPRGRPGGRSPLRRCLAQLIQSGENLPSAWRREGGIDSGLRPSPFGRRVRVVQNRRRRFCRTPFSISRVRIPASWLPRPNDRKRREFVGRLAEREGFEPSMGF
jgi:hypothetical protein